MQGGSDMTAQLSPWAKAMETMHLQMLPSPSAGASNGADHHLISSCSISSFFHQQEETGGKLRRAVPIRSYRLLYYQLSFSFSHLLYGKGLLITTEYFTLWESGSFCFCFCPHWMFLSAPCEGTGNYRAIHLNLHNFRQIL